MSPHIDKGDCLVHSRSPNLPQNVKSPSGVADLGTPVGPTPDGDNSMGGQNWGRTTRCTRETLGLFHKTWAVTLTITSFFHHLKMLIKHKKFDPNAKDNQGLNLLMKTMVAKNVAAMRSIFNAGAWASQRNHRVPSLDDNQEVAGMDVPTLGRNHVRSKKVMTELGKLDALEASLGPLHRAARSGNLTTVNEALEKISGPSMELRKRDAEGNSALHYACINGNVAVVESLISNGANIRAVNNDDQNMLHVAVLHGNYSLVKYLLKLKKFNLSDKDSDGRTPLMMTAECGSARLLRMLIAAGAPKDPSILGIAAQKGCLAYLRHAAKKLGMNLSHVDNDGKTVLHHAASKSHPSVITYLLKDMNNVPKAILKQEKSGKNVLHLICESEGPNQKESLQLVCDKAEEHGILKMLIDAKDFFTGLISCVLVSGKDRGRPAYHYVETCRHTMSLFEKKVSGGSVDVSQYGRVVKSGWGENPAKEVITAVENSFFQRLTTHNPEKDLTPLHLAVYHKKVELAKLLIQYKADVNVQDNFGLTPLHLASMRGLQDMVEILLDVGADATIKSQQQHIAADLASLNEHIKLADIIRGKSQLDTAEDLIEDLTRKLAIVKNDDLKKLRHEGGNVHTHLVSILRGLQIDLNIALHSIGSSPIVEESQG